MGEGIVGKLTWVGVAREVDVDDAAEGKDFFFAMKIRIEW